MSHVARRRIDTERLTLRCDEPVDAEAMSETITAEREPWTT